MSSSSSDSTGEGLAALAIALTVVAALISLWLAVKGVDLVIRVMVKHPTNRPMWVALAFMSVCIVAMIMTSGLLLAVDALMALSVVAVLVTARAVELYYDDMLQLEWNRDTVVHEVLHEPWWNAA